MTTVNVLEVLDLATEELRVDARHTMANALAEARAAVAELAATQVETLRMLEAAYMSLGKSFRDNKRVIRAKQAVCCIGDLSRIGGEA